MFGSTRIQLMIEDLSGKNLFSGRPQDKSSHKPPFFHSSLGHIQSLFKKKVVPQMNEYEWWRNTRGFILY